MQLFQAWKDGHIHSVVEPDGSELHVACIDTRFRDFPTLRKAKLWITARSAKPERIDRKTIKPKRSRKHPVLYFYDALNRMVYSSQFYQSVAHAWAWIDPTAEPKIVRIVAAQPIVAKRRKL